MLNHDPFLALLLITGLALVVPVLANRLKRIAVPIVVGEILAGIVIGRSGFDLVESSAILEFLSEFGFTFLMFLSGLEIDIGLLVGRAGGDRSGWRGPLPLAITTLGGTIGLAVLSAAALSRLGLVDSPILVGLILSTTSLGVVVPVLKERGLLGSSFGQVVLVAASVADFVTLLLLTVVIAVRSQGLTFDLLLIPLLLLIFLLAARFSRLLSGLRFLPRLLEELSSATAQIRVRGAFALMIGWVVLAEALGVEVILGAFLAGAIAGLIGDPDEENARAKLDAIGFGFFIPIFFIMVGVEFNLRSLLASPQAMLLVPVLVLVAYLVKVIPALVLKIGADRRGIWLADSCYQPDCPSSLPQLRSPAIWA